MALLYSKFQIFSFTPSPNYYHPPSKWDLGNAITISDYHTPPPSISDLNLKCRLLSPLYNKNFESKKIMVSKIFWSFIIQIQLLRQLVLSYVCGTIDTLPYGNADIKSTPNWLVFQDAKEFNSNTVIHQGS